jgi:eukaryotic-like serine/threonine-protein kinase
VSKVFGSRYEVLERIGSGGMAIVYKAKDLLLNRIVTIKVLREQFAADEDFVRRFRREAQSAASLSHTNIVSIYDVGKEGETEYIVMEFVEGRNLKEIIRNYAPLSTEQAINIGIQIAEAIRHAHEHKIIHRDIKPHNILVTADGRVKVTDFGIARAVSAATMTHTGDIVGSVHYLSPEQAKGVQTNEQSDVYSLGIILYELLTGKVPYDGETPISIALKHLQEEAVPPTKLNPRVNRAFENVVLRAIAKSPEQRYATAKELLQDLRNVQAGQPVHKLESKEQHDLESTRVHRSLSSGVNSALASEAKEKEQVEAPSRKKKIPSWLWITAVVIILAMGGAWFGLSKWLNVGTTEVPPLVGKTVADAGVFAQQFNLKLDPNVAEEFNQEVEKGRIIRTEPAEKSKVKVGREIKLWVSKGPELLKFPNLKTGQLTQEAAVNMLESMGFKGKIKVETNNNSTQPSGTVVGQDPAAGAEWPKNGEIHLQISGGAPNQSFPMPSVIGKSVPEARGLLEQYKLTVVVDSKDSTDFPADVVMETSPKPGEMVQQGKVVTIIVSRGPGPLAMSPAQPVYVANSR